MNLKQVQKILRESESLTTQNISLLVKLENNLSNWLTFYNDFKQFAFKVNQLETKLRTINVLQKYLSDLYSNIFALLNEIQEINVTLFLYFSLSGKVGFLPQFKVKGMNKLFRINVLMNNLLKSIKESEEKLQ